MNDVLTLKELMELIPESKWNLPIFVENNRNEPIPITDGNLRKAVEKEQFDEDGNDYCTYTVPEGIEPGERYICLYV